MHSIWFRDGQGAARRLPEDNPCMACDAPCERAFEVGWAGTCFKTVCSPDIHEASPRFSAITGDSGSIMGFRNIEQLSDHSVTENKEIFRRIKARYPTKFILASIMGQNEAEWGELARLSEGNGADTAA